MKISKRDFKNLKLLCNAVVPDVFIDEVKILKVLNSMHPNVKNSWILYLKTFGWRFKNYSENKLKRMAYKSPFKEFLMPIRYAAFCDDNFDTICTNKEKWEDQIIDSFDEQNETTYDCDYIVIGSGAGGASVAYKLASLGYAVLIIEEGAHHTRKTLRGDPLSALRNLYRGRGFQLAWGKKIFPVTSGCSVGGTTIINSGTCIRYPKYILDEWEDKFGLEGFNSELFGAKYDEASSILNVSNVEDKYIGKIGRNIKKAADKLGWKNGPLPRNAIGCDGQATCCFGCPTGAKMSTDISFIPRALKNGARLLINTKADEIIMNNGTAVAVLASTKTINGTEQNYIVPEKGVILSCGALLTPKLLRKSGIENSNIGKNLSLHPSIAVFSMHRNEVNMTTNSVPQGYHVPFLPNFVLEGASMPSPIASMAMNSIGKEYSYIMNNYNRLSIFGALIRDTSKGFVLNNGHVLYNINSRDMSTIQNALKKLIKLLSNIDDVEEVYPFIKGLHKIKWYNEDSPWKNPSINKYHKLDKITPNDITISAYHPLGSCRMGLDPSISVVNENYKVWGTKNLYIVDGSVFPDSTGLNPQLTIMAMGLRAGEMIGV